MCPRCGWLFVDISRGGKRRWCNMRVCGNREKVARHRGQVASYEVR
ncbi:CGNR zinc finger domain-containing protein [Mesorhizobium sp. M0199]